MAAQIALLSTLAGTGSRVSMLSPGLLAECSGGIAGGLLQTSQHYIESLAQSGASRSILTQCRTWAHEK